MAEDIKVKPTPIQRNSLDVATELTQMYYERVGIGNPEQIQEVWIKFYTIAETASSISIKNLTAYMPADLKSIVDSIYSRK